MFKNKFKLISNDNIILKLSETNVGNDVILPFYYYDILNKENTFVGKISIRIGNNYHSYYNGHIGFHVEKEHRGNNYSMYAVNAIKQVALEHNMNLLYITCKVSNFSSRAIIEKLGAKLLEITNIPKDCFFYEEGIEKFCIYKLDL